jgi:uncharacterized membrane protein YhfC
MIDVKWLAHFLNGLLPILIPIGLGIFIAHRWHVSWRLWLIGGATFILSQVGHIPFNYGVNVLLRKGVLPLPPTAWLPIFDAVWLGLSSGLWEEWSRYAAYRWWAKDARSWSKGLMMGAGHGGVESIIVGGLILWTFINMVAYRNIDLSTVVPANQAALAQQQVINYWALPWYASMLGALERIFTIPFHMAASLLVLQAFTRGRLRWVWLSVLWHSTINFLAVYAGRAWGDWIAESLIGLSALISIGIILALRTPEAAPQAEPPNTDLITPAPVQLPEVEETQENLDNTRYN